MEVKKVSNALNEFYKFKLPSPEFIKTLSPEIFAEAMGFFIGALEASKANKNMAQTRIDHEKASKKENDSFLKKKENNDFLDKTMRIATEESFVNLALFAKACFSPIA